MEKSFLQASPHSLKCLLSYTTQDHLSSDGTTHSGMGPPTSIINQENDWHTFWEVSWWRNFLNWGFLHPDELLFVYSWHKQHTYMHIHTHINNQNTVITYVVMLTTKIVKNTQHSFMRNNIQRILKGAVYNWWMIKDSLLQNLIIDAVALIYLDITSKF